MTPTKNRATTLLKRAAVKDHHDIGIGDHPFRVSRYSDGDFPMIFEQPREIVGILEAETVADLLDALAGQVQMLAGPLDFEPQIVIDGE